MPPPSHCVPEQNLTSFEDHAVIGDLVARLQAGAVPAVTSELVLALVDGDLDALDGGGRDVRVAHADVLLPAVQARQREADRVGVEDGVDVGQLQAQDLVGVHHPAGLRGGGETVQKSIEVSKAWFILLRKVLYVGYGQPSP